MALSPTDKIIIDALSSRFKSIKVSDVDVEEEEVEEYREAQEFDVPRTFAARGKANLEAIKLTIGVNKPELTKEEEKKIKKFTGWGGFSLNGYPLPPSITKNLPKSVQNELKKKMPKNREKESLIYWVEQIRKEVDQDFDIPDPYTATTVQYYTPYKLIEKIHGYIRPLFTESLKDGNVWKVLEPSAGVGRFLQPFSNKFAFYAVEKYTFPYEMLMRSYPKATAINSTFEKFANSTAGFGLMKKVAAVVANPPYGRRNATEKDADPDFSKFNNISDYQMFRSLLFLKEKGIGVFLVTSSFMTGTEKKSLRAEILKRNHFLGAIRLPSTKEVRTSRGKTGTTQKAAIFEGTQIIVDIVFLQRRKGTLRSVSGEPLKELGKIAASFLNGTYFGSQIGKKYVIGKYKKDGRGRKMLVVKGDDPLKLLPSKIEFFPFVEQPASKFIKEKVLEIRTGAFAIQNCTKSSPQIQQAIEFGHNAVAFLSSLVDDPEYAYNSQDLVLEQLKVFKATFPTQSEQLKLLKVLEGFGCSADAQKILVAIEREADLKKPIKLGISLEMDEERNIPLIASKLINLNASIQKPAPSLSDICSIYRKYNDASISKIAAFKKLLASDTDFVFFICKDGKVRFEDSSSYYTGILWNKYDTLLDSRKRARKMNADLKKEVLPVLAAQLKILRGYLELRPASFILENSKATPKDTWVPIEIVDAWFKEWYDTDNNANGYNTGGRSTRQKILPTSSFDIVRNPNNPENLFLKTNFVNIADGFGDEINNQKLVLGKVYWMRSLADLLDDSGDVQKLIADEYPAENLKDAKQKQLEEYFDIKARYDQFMREYDSEMKRAASEKERGVKTVEVNAIKNLAEKTLAFKSRIIFNMMRRNLFDLVDEKYKKVFIPVASLKSMEIWEPHRQAMGWMTSSKSLFRPSFSEISERNGWNTLEYKGENPDDARLRLEKEYLSSWKRFLVQNQDYLEEVTELYNRIFRGYKKPKLDGRPIKILGWSDAIELRPYQNAAVRKMVTDNGGLLALDVGLGKTFSGIATIGAMKQLGKAKRPVIVVPKTLVWNWVSEISLVFPKYNVVVLSQFKNKNGGISPRTSPVDRGRVWLDFKTGLYDVLIMTYGDLETIKVSKKRFDDYVSYQIRQMVPKAPKGLSPKELLQTYELASAKVYSMVMLGKKRSYDQGVTFEDVGVDFLMVDEAQNFKNLYEPTPPFSERVQYLGIGKASRRSFALDIRCQSVREDKNGAIVLLSATPAKNSPMEFYNLIQYTKPEAFKGIPSAAAFLSRYIRVETQRIPDTTVSTKMAPIVAGFKNLDEFRDLLDRYTMFETLGTIIEKYGNEYPDLRERLKIPEVETYINFDKSGKKEKDLTQEDFLDPTPQQEIDIENIILAAFENTAEQSKYWPLIKARAEASESEQPMKKMIPLEVLFRLTAVSIHPFLNDFEVDYSSSGDKKSSADMTEEEKANRDAKRQKEKKILGDKGTLNSESAAAIAKRLDTDKEWIKKYGGLESPKIKQCVKNVMSDIAEGGCGHIIFAENILAHYMIKLALVKKGVKEERIALLNGLEAKSSLKRQQISEEFNGNPKEGIQPKFDVVIANQIAYEGINLQLRTCMIHHIDLGWEPATIQQRNGRGVRQGNRYNILKIFYYVLVGTADAYRLKMIEAKRNWLIEAVESQDIESNNMLAGQSLGANDVLLFTLRDPAALEAELQARKATLEIDRLRDFRMKSAAEMSAIRDSFYIAEQLKGSPDKYGDALKYAEEKLQKFQNDVDVNVYPFAKLAPLLRENAIYAPPKSPIGVVYINSMVYRIRFDDFDSVYVVSGLDLKSNVSKGLRRFYLDRGLNFTSTSKWFGFKKLLTANGSMGLNSTDETELQNHFQKYLDNLYGMDEEGQIRKQVAVDNGSALSELLFNSGALDLNQNMNLPDNMKDEKMRYGQGGFVVFYPEGSDEKAMESFSSNIPLKKQGFSDRVEFKRRTAFVSNKQKADSRILYGEKFEYYMKLVKNRIDENFGEEKRLPIGNLRQFFISQRVLEFLEYNGNTSSQANLLQIRKKIRNIGSGVDWLGRNYSQVIMSGYQLGRNHGGDQSNRLFTFVINSVDGLLYMVDKNQAKCPFFGNIDELVIGKNTLPFSLKKYDYSTQKYTPMDKEDLYFKDISNKDRLFVGSNALIFKMNNEKGKIKPSDIIKEFIKKATRVIDSGNSEKRVSDDNWAEKSFKFTKVKGLDGREIIKADYKLKDWRGDVKNISRYFFIIDYKFLAPTRANFATVSKMIEDNQFGGIIALGATWSRSYGGRTMNYAGNASIIEVMKDGNNTQPFLGLNPDTAISVIRQYFGQNPSLKTKEALYNTNRYRMNEYLPQLIEKHQNKGKK